MIASEGGGDVSGGEQHEEARGDGQTEARAAIFGGKMRQEELVFIFGRDAVAGVGDADFDGVRFGVHAGGNGDFAMARILEGFGGVVDEVDEDAAEEDTVGADGGEILGERGFYGDAVETAGENLEGFADQGGGVRWRELGAGEAHELRELIYEIGEG